MKLLVGFLFSLLAAAQLPEGAVKIYNVIYTGNGCPQGSVSSSLSPDGTVSC
jgi:hypothetical protein